MTPVLALVAAAPALGGAEAAVDFSGSTCAVGELGRLSNLASQVRLGEALATARAARLVWRHAIDEVCGVYDKGRKIPAAERGGLRLAAAHTVRLSLQAVNIVMEGAGASVHFDDSPLQRIQRDVLILKGHVASIGTAPRSSQANSRSASSRLSPTCSDLVAESRSKDPMHNNEESGWRMPAEYEPHERTIVCWPARREIWGRHYRQAELDYAEIVRAIAPFEPVTVIARPDTAETAQDLCGSAADVVEIAIDDSWARDSGPLYVVNGAGSRQIIDFRFNAWGEKFHPFGDDSLLKQRWATMRQEGHVEFDLVLEGGAIGVDGAGTLVTTQQCLLHPNRNPSHSRVEIEDQMRSALGVETIVWLPWGLSLDDDTDGHVDNVAAFAEPGRLLMQACDDPSEADHERLRINARWAKGAVDADGRPIAVVEVPVLPFVDVDAERICVPYLNLYVCNGAVIVPVTGHHADTEMLALIGSEFPGRTVLPVPGLTLAIGGGGPHCITQQVPVS